MQTNAALMPLEARAKKWLADATQAQQDGRTVKAERCFQKAQFWLDRANYLSGQGSSTVPSK